MMVPRFTLGLYLITDERLARGRSTIDIVRAAIDGGVDAVQFRGKDLAARVQVELCLELRRITREAHVLFIVNDRADLARAVDADGVHVGPDDLPPDLARLVVGPDRLVGFSAASVEEARWGLARGADYLGVGAIYGTTTKGDAGSPVGPERISEITSAVNLPVVGIGGITAANAAAVLRAGAAGIAVISAIVGAKDVTAATRELKQRVVDIRAERRST